MQEITVRNILREDIARLHAIRTNRQVAEFQLPPCSIHRWRRQIEGAENTPGLSYRCTTILVNGEVAGLISQSHYQKPGAAYTVVCGWSLAPDYWGRGVMQQALTAVFDQFFLEQKVRQVVADTFAGNVRNLRLMEKTGFTPVRMTFRGRLWSAWQYRSLRRLRRYAISAETWWELRAPYIENRRLPE